MAARQSTLNYSYWKNQLQALILINDNSPIWRYFVFLQCHARERVFVGRR